MPIGGGNSTSSSTEFGTTCKSGFDSRTVSRSSVFGTSSFIGGFFDSWYGAASPEIDAQGQAVISGGTIEQFIKTANP